MTAGLVIAGGGLAGAAAALGLARAGVPVTLIERETKPVNKICGEFLSTEAQDYLSKLSLDTAGLGGAAISRLRLVRGADSVATDLPFAAIGLSRRKLDEALLRRAQDAGVRLVRGHGVRNVASENKIVLDVEGIGMIEPDVLMLATGKHEVRGIKRDFTAPPNLIGFKMYFRLRRIARRSLDGHIELIFFPGGYAGLQMIEEGVTNLCLLVNRAQYRRCGATWKHLLDYLKVSSAVLAERLEGAEQMLTQPLTIYQVPYGFIHRPSRGDCGKLFRLGDQACVIQSFTGDGMSIALHSAALAVRAYLAGADADAYHRKLAHDIRGQIRRADMLYALMNNPAAQAALFKTSQVWPGGLKIVASLTRVPKSSRVENKKCLA